MDLCAKKGWIYHWWTSWNEFMKVDESTNDWSIMVETQSGGGQGCTFGGVVFSMLLAKAVKDVPRGTLTVRAKWEI